MAFSVAVQVYSVRDDAAADLRGTLEKIKKMGYDGVELAGLYDNDPADIKKMCDEIGLTPLQNGVGVPNIRYDVATLSKYLWHDILKSDLFHLQSI